MEFLLSFGNLVLTIAVFLTVLSVLVAAHELGHYLFARWFGMGVEEFAIGFGPKKLITFLRSSYVLPIDDKNAELGKLEYGSDGGGLEGGQAKRVIEIVETPDGRGLKETTEFTIRPIPLGGFVRIKGMMPEADGSETRIVGGFYSKAPWQRLLVLFAGPLFSFLAGIIMLIPVFAFVGVMQPVNTIQVVGPNSAAAKAGLEAKDKLVGLNGVRTDSPKEFKYFLSQSAGKEVKLRYERNGVERETVVVPELTKEPIMVLGRDGEPTGRLERQGMIGFAWEQERVPVAFDKALNTAFLLPVRVAESIIGIFIKPNTFTENIGGPGTIFTAISVATADGFVAVIEIAALLSISLGVFNLLPIPPLDGGQMVVALIEMIRRGKRLSIKLQEVMATVGFGLVLLLMVSAIYSDVKRFGPGSKPLPAKDAVPELPETAPVLKEK